MSAKEKAPKRVMIIGSPGSGKSTMARRLSELLGLPVVHLDKLWWKPNWVEASKEEFDEKLGKELAKDRWIMDGNFSRTIELRFERADTVIILDFPRTVCVARALKRVAGTYGRVRPDMGEGCPERLDLSFIKFIWNFKQKDIVKQMLSQAAEKRIYVIHNNRELKDFYAEMESLR